jgi:hypothetical protein
MTVRILMGNAPIQTKEMVVERLLELGIPLEYVVVQDELQ